MKLATFRSGRRGTTAAVAVGEDTYIPLPYASVGSMLMDNGWREVAEDAASGRKAGAVPLHGAQADLAPLLPAAAKVICCGLNYGDHIQEMGRALPDYPTLFAKYADTLVGASDPIYVHGSDKVDWEAELAVVIGSNLYRVDEDQALAGIAGYTVANDVSMRDWQNRTLQWFQGKAFDATTPLGPVMLTADEAPADFDVYGYVNGEQVQKGNTSTLVFGPARLVAYISQFTMLRPGDVVLTGTPGGVGMGMNPPRFLSDGDVLTTEIPGIGRLENRIYLSSTNDPGTTAPTLSTTSTTKE
ncbi:fumarylacetoacetate hydrolase family protein [Arthrobacter sp. Rue61a]|uniref:fumarylacetoacetate hydrolase family protein n=1 Tax=Arthrobacter sp. Rue61a TaxID=1118963 RepID=UPI000150AE4F|nr:fumarylacetoacetate hydrolase family protein [Arthrobacter sp. Rue61a]AFR34528.1 putative fumarylacetoacetate hydrolase family protein [Arthrobacter sp. Rue61a]